MAKSRRDAINLYQQKTCECAGALIANAVFAIVCLAIAACSDVPLARMLAFSGFLAAVATWSCLHALILGITAHRYEDGCPSRLATWLRNSMAVSSIACFAFMFFVAHAMSHQRLYDYDAWASNALGAFALIYGVIFLGHWAQLRKFASKARLVEGWREHVRQYPRTHCFTRADMVRDQKVWCWD
jgi:hypothetical protein